MVDKLGRSLGPSFIELQPKLALEIRCNLENLSALSTCGDDFRYYLKLKCSNCGEESKNWQYITPEELHELKGSRGTAHLVETCKLCKRQNNIEILPNSTHSYAGDAKNLQFQPIVTFDCRGIEPTEFEPRIGWIAETEDGVRFDDVDLSEKDWADYDERQQQPVSISEFEYRFTKVH